MDDGELPNIDMIPDDEDIALANADSSDEEEAEEENYDPNNLDTLERGSETQKWKRSTDDLQDSTRKSTRKNIARDYYSSNSTGKSVAGVIYHLAE